MIALPLAAPPISSSARAVVRVNSSMFCRVPGPADRDATVETISAYGTVAARLTAATIGTVAWPPQVIMFTFGASRCWSRFTVGTTFGPRAAGVRSIAVMPSSASTCACRTCTYALVASKTRSMSAACSRTQSMPVSGASIPSALALVSPSLAGSMPTRATRSSTSDRISLIIRSVPMLPEPMIAHRVANPAPPCCQLAADDFVR